MDWLALGFVVVLTAVIWRWPREFLARVGFRPRSDRDERVWIAFARCVSVIVLGVVAGVALGVLPRA